MTFSQRAVEAAAESVRECRAKMAASFDSPDPTEIAYDEFLARAALTAALAVDGVALQGWQDISTAPKDGTNFLSIYGLDDDGTYWIIFWNGAYFECVSSGFEVEHATHWMPLPKPPAASEGEERTSPPQDKP